MARRRLAKLRRPLRSDEKLVFRDRKGRTRKFRSDILLVAEVWSKKTKKRVGVLNNVDKKTKLPIPRRYSSTQKAFMQTPKGRFKTNVFRKLGFTVRSNQFVIDQIPNAVIDEINSEVRERGRVFLKVRVEFTDGTFSVSPELVLDRPVIRDVLAKMIGVHVVNAARSVQMRMSPQKFARNAKEKNWKHAKKAWVICILSTSSTEGMKNDKLSQARKRSNAQSKTRRNKRTKTRRSRSKKR